MMKLTRAAVLAAAFLAFASAAARAENWPQWRGPFFNGSTTETNLPEKFSPAENCVWTARLPGIGASTPAVWGDRVFATAQDPASKKTFALCLSVADGSILWQHEIADGADFARGNTAASPSPIADADRAYFYFGTGDLAAFDFGGKSLWRRNIARDHGPFEIKFGYASSPLLFAGRLYVPVIQGRESAGKMDISYFLCIDPATGRDLWKHRRPSDANAEAKQAYTTPVPFHVAGRDQILLTGADYVTAHDPATGEELWRSPSYDPQRHELFRTVASAAVAGETVFVAAPRNTKSHGLRIGPDGRPAANAWTWTLDKNAPDACTPAVYAGKFLVLDGDSRYILRVDPAGGQILQRERIDDAAVFQASPTVADGKIYCISMDGEVVVLAAADFKVLHRADFGGKECRSTIAVAAGRLFIRAGDRLFAIARPD